MLNISFLAYTKVELWDLTVCIAINGEKFHSDLDLGPTMPNIELVRDIFIYNNVFKFHVPKSISFLSYHAKTHAHKHMQTHTNTDAHTQRVILGNVSDFYNLKRTVNLHAFHSLRN